MGRPKRLYPLGKYRLRTPKEIDKNKAYSVELEYTWNRQAIRKSTNVFVKVADWNQKGNQGRGEIRASYGSEYKRMNQLLIARVDRIDAQRAGCCRRVNSFSDNKLRNLSAWAGPFLEFEIMTREESCRIE